MLRARLAALAMSGGLVLISGCMGGGMGGGGGGLFSGLHRNQACDCGDSYISGPIMSSPTSMGGPELVQPAPLPPPTYPGTNPQTAPPPRVMPIPQAPTIPYTP